MRPLLAAQSLSLLLATCLGDEFARLTGDTLASCEGVYQRSADVIDGKPIWDRVALNDGTPSDSRFIFYRKVEGSDKTWHVSSSKYREGLLNGSATGAAGFIHSDNDAEEWYLAGWSKANASAFAEDDAGVYRGATDIAANEAVTNATAAHEDDVLQLPSKVTPVTPVSAVSAVADGKCSDWRRIPQGCDTSCCSKQADFERCLRADSILLAKLESSTATYADCSGTYMRSDDMVDGHAVWDRVDPDNDRIIFHQKGKWQVTGSQWRSQLLAGTLKHVGAYIESDEGSTTEWYDAAWARVPDHKNKGPAGAIAYAVTSQPGCENVHKDIAMCRPCASWTDCCSEFELNMNATAVEALDTAMCDAPLCLEPGTFAMALEGEASHTSNATLCTEYAEQGHPCTWKSDQAKCTVDPCGTPQARACAPAEWTKKCGVDSAVSMEQQICEDWEAIPAGCDPQCCYTMAEFAGCADVKDGETPKAGCKHAEAELKRCEPCASWASCCPVMFCAHTECQCYAKDLITGSSSIGDLELCEKGARLTPDDCLNGDGKCQWGPTECDKCRTSDTSGETHDDVMFLHNGNRHQLVLERGTDNMLLSWPSQSREQVVLSGRPVSWGEKQWFKSFTLTVNKKQVFNVSAPVSGAGAIRVSVDGKREHRFNSSAYLVSDSTEAFTVTGTDGKLGGLNPATLLLHSQPLQFSIQARPAAMFKSDVDQARYAHLSISIDGEIPSTASGLFAELAGVHPRSADTEMRIKNLKDGVDHGVLAPSR